ncbi:MAG: ROK family protein [Thermaerobacter sp.]|nr:ROK family protein [Thermaerobacter sp.]
MIRHAVGLDVGGTKTTVALGRYDDAAPWDSLELLSQHEMATGSGRDDPAELLGRCTPLIGQYLNADRDAIIGISLGGPLDRCRGVIGSPPHLPGWHGLAIVDAISTRFGREAALEHDGVASALAEARWGAGRGLENVVYLTFGTGLGAGLILHGAPYRGRGFSGEIGRTPVQPGSEETYELYCSGWGLAVRARARGLTDAEADPRVLAERARGGEPRARQLYEESARGLGGLLSLLVNLLNPDCIAIGGIFTYQRDLLWPRAREYASLGAWPQAWEGCRVVPSALGRRIGHYAGIAAALEKRFGPPCG